VVGFPNWFLVFASAAGVGFCDEVAVGPAVASVILSGEFLGQCGGRFCDGGRQGFLGLHQGG